ncbi:hypothetical protein CVT24_008493, partial [Panaeolus cyanescens]
EEEEGGFTVSVRGDTLSRDEQVHWQGLVRDKMREVGRDVDYPIYELLSTHLLPLLHEEISRKASTTTTSSSTSKLYHTTPIQPEPLYHALFSSHHLISPTKRRSLQSWSHSLSLQGFAKVGYPGVIYAQGRKDDVLEFVGNVKGMQWLALRLRFVEELPGRFNANANESSNEIGKVKKAVEKDGEYEVLEGWREVEKVGEVVEMMRRIGREEYVVEMGIGSAGT